MAFTDEEKLIKAKAAIKAAIASFETWEEENGLLAAIQGITPTKFITMIKNKSETREQAQESEAARLTEDADNEQLFQDELDAL
jgi:hypothetical protein